MNEIFFKILINGKKEPLFPGVFGIFGPKSRLLMNELSKDDFRNENFKFATSKFIDIENTKILLFAIIIQIYLNL